MVIINDLSPVRLSMSDIHGELFSNTLIELVEHASWLLLPLRSSTPRFCVLLMPNLVLAHGADPMLFSSVNHVSVAEVTYSMSQPNIARCYQRG